MTPRIFKHLTKGSRGPAATADDFVVHLVLEDKDDMSFLEEAVCWTGHTAPVVAPTESERILGQKWLRGV